MKVLIAGGGIGGLTAAIALTRHGHEVSLVEKRPTFEPVGAGIVLASNATRVLLALGVDLKDGHPVKRMDLATRGGSLLQAAETASLAGAYGPVLTFARPELHEALQQALPSTVRIETGRGVAKVSTSDDGVNVGFDDGSSAQVDLLVGADGLRSSVRQAIGIDAPLRYSGVTCWRTIVKNPGIDEPIETWGGDARIGLVPLSKNRLYVFLVLAAPPRAPAPSFPDGFRAAFGGFSGKAAGVVDLLAGADLLHHDLDELEAPVWGKEKVPLLGDAAHGMTPNQGQGAAMAIEDAWVLASELDSPVGAFERYVTRRHARVRKVQLDSRRIGQVSHWTFGPAVALRNTLLRLMPASVARKQVEALVQPGVQLVA